jgi:hypothetical protein
MTMEMKNSLVTLQPGIYILRHPKGGMPPLSIARGPGGVGRHEVMATPRTHGSILRDGSDCIVMQVYEAPVDILVTAYVELMGDVTPELRIDKIGLDAETRPVVGAPAVAPVQPIEIEAKGISIIGHIERTGDVVVGEGRQMGKPGSDLRLEGFQVMWPDKPDGVDLAYGLTVEGGEPGTMVGVGQFCGTRSMARRVTEVIFVLTGARADQFRFDGTAQFSGGFSASIRSGVALTGPSGLEHLTSISLRVLPVEKEKKNLVKTRKDAPRKKVREVRAVVKKPVPIKAPTTKPKPKAKAKVNSKAKSPLKAR